MATQTPIRVEPGASSRLTEALAAQAAGLSFDSLPREVIELSEHCLLDWLGVTIAGAREPLVRMLTDEAIEQGGNPQASLIGQSGKVSTQQAALVNGTASHALDYDDVNLTIEGHPSVAVIPGLLALAEHRGSSGADFITAFTAGYETACRVGRLVSPGHYRRGFHATATAGSFGSAAACARLIGLSPEATATAFGIAGTQAAGLKSMFGTMCKPFHAGKAAQNGLLAASLAARGFDSRNDVLECAQGFADTQSNDFHPAAALAEPARGYHMRANLFKYHAACYLTHSTIECCRRMRERFEIAPDSIRGIVVRADEALNGVCNIQSPQSGLEAKFSLRMTAAFALAGVDTASVESYSAANCADPALVALRDKVRVELVSGWPLSKCEVDIELRDAQKISDSHDSGIPAGDLAVQRERLEAKFHSLVDPIVGAGHAARLAAVVRDLDRLSDPRELISLCQI